MASMIPRGQLPSIGRIVHYNDDSLEVRAAIITAVRPVPHHGKVHLRISDVPSGPFVSTAVITAPGGVTQKIETTTRRDVFFREVKEVALECVAHIEDVLLDCPPDLWHMFEGATEWTGRPVPVLDERHADVDLCVLSPIGMHFVHNVPCGTQENRWMWPERVG